MGCETLYKAKIVISDISQDLLRALHKAFIAEAKSPANVGRVHIDVELTENELVIDIGADSLSHLRAIVNSFLYLLHAAIASIEKVRS